MNHPNGPHSERNDPSTQYSLLLLIEMHHVPRSCTSPVEGWAVLGDFSPWDGCLVSEGPTLHCASL